MNDTYEVLVEVYDTEEQEVLGYSLITYYSRSDLDLADAKAAATEQALKIGQGKDLMLEMRITKNGKYFDSDNAYISKEGEWVI